LSTTIVNDYRLTVLTISKGFERIILVEFPNGGRMAELLEGIGYNIRRLRDEKGWNQTELGFRSDTSPSMISLIENGKRNPSTATLAKIARALGVEVVDLFPKAQSPLPFEEAPSLEDLHVAAGCESDWLICPEARWWTSWPAEPCPRVAMERVRETATEFAKLRPSMAEQERGLRPSQTKFGGRYQQAWQRYFYTLKEAKARGVTAGIIRDEETLDDLEERLGGQPSHYLDAILRDAS
jgi:transcriptional regulator with XRE-family HTH domain